MRAATATRRDNRASTSATPSALATLERVRERLETSREKLYGVLKSECPGGISTDAYEPLLCAVGLFSGVDPSEVSISAWERDKTRDEVLSVCDLAIASLRREVTP
jgi:hypothetical protein